MLLQLFVQTSPIAGRVLAFGVPFNCPLSALAQVMRQTAAKLDEIEANATPDEASPARPQPDPSEPSPDPA